MSRARSSIVIRLVRISFALWIAALSAADAAASARAERSTNYNRATARATVGNQTNKQDNPATGNPAPQVSAAATASKWFGKADALATAGPQACKVMTKVVGLGGAGIAQNSSHRGGAAIETESSSEDSASVVVTPIGPTSLDLGLTGYFDIAGTPSTTGASMKFVLAVYPDTATANADSLGVGTGASFYGRLFVQVPGAGASVSGAFSTSHFTVDATKGEFIRVYTVPNLTYHVTGVNVNQAVVSLYLDPESTVASTPVPAMGPISGVAVVLLLAVSGGWMARRRRPARAFLGQSS